VEWAQCSTQKKIHRRVENESENPEKHIYSILPDKNTLFIATWFFLSLHPA